jgi:hypothetical protein
MLDGDIFVIELIQKTKGRNSLRPVAESSFTEFVCDIL